MTLTELVIYLIATASAGALFGAIPGFLMNGLAGAKGGAIAGALAGPILAGIVITVWASWPRQNEKKSTKPEDPNAEPTSAGDVASAAPEK